MGRLAVAAVVFSFLTWSADAIAQSKPPKPEDLSAVSQYRESIPSSSGSTFAGTAVPQTKPLSEPVRKKVVRQAGKRAGLLEQVATSSTYGAPQKRLPHPPASAKPEGADAGSALASAPGSFFESVGRARLLGLLVVLVAVTAVAAVAARRRVS